MSRRSNAAPTSTNPLRAVIYTRVSRDQARGRSVKEQEKECRATCEREGWPVADVLIDNDRSATRFATKDRPEYEKLRTILQPGDVLVCWEASRAGRSLDHYVDLRRLCSERVVLLSYSGRLFDLDDGDDRFVTGLDALIAEREAEDIRKRIVRTHRANLADNKPHGRVPYGYRIIRDPDTGKAVGREPDPARAPLVAEAARRVLDGHSFASVVRWMESKDLLGWDSAKLRRILVNPTTAGYRTHSTTMNGKRGPQMIHGPGTWEPIITEDQHNELVALFAARKSGPRGAAVKHLASGIATCDVCGQTMWRRNGGRKREGGFYQVYTCAKTHVARRMDLVDDAIHAVVEGILSTPEARAALAEAPKADPIAVARLAGLKEQLEAIETEMAEMRMPAATGARVAARLTEQIAAAEAAAAPTFIDPTVREIATAPDPVALWRSLPVARQRAFIKAVLTVTIEPVGRGRWHDKRAGIVITPRRNTFIVA